MKASRWQKEPANEGKSVKEKQIPVNGVQKVQSLFVANDYKHARENPAIVVRL